jgi:hypothetical protein
MLIGNVITKLDIPHETGEWVEIRKLNHKTLARAAQMRSEAGISSMKSLGAELLTALRQARDDLKEAATVAVSLDAYDRDLVLQGGVWRWSYSTPVTPESLGDLDEATAKWLATEIVTRSIAPADPVAVGNVTPPSTVS